MGFRIENRVGVAAPPHVIWDLVSKLEGWPEWSELYTEAGGKLTIGEKLHFTFKLGDRPPQSVEGTVYDWVPEAQMAWKVSLYGGLVRSLRYVEIEKLTETSCILANGDYWTGLLANRMPRPLRRLAQHGFERMNQNAKRICEERFVAEGGVVAPAPSADEYDSSFHIEPLMKPTGVAAVKYWGTQGRSTLGPKLRKS